MTMDDLNDSSYRPKVHVFIAIFFTATNSMFFKLSTVPAMVFVSCRFFICAVFFLLMLTFSARRSKSKGINISKGTACIFVLVGFVFSLGAFTYFIALKNTALTSVLILTSTNAIFIVILSLIVLRDRPKLMAVISILVTIGGCAIVFSGRTGGVNSLLGNICALICPLCAAIYTVVMKKFSHTDVPTRLCLVYAGSFLFAFIIALIQDNSFLHFENGQAIPYYEYIWMICSGLFSVCLPQYLVNRSLRSVKATFVGSIGLLEPVLGTIYGLFLWGETLTIYQVIGGIIVLGGLCFYNWIA